MPATATARRRGSPTGRPTCCCAGWSSPSAGGWTACCRATTSGWCPGSGSRGRRLPHVPPRGRRPAHGLAGHRAHAGAARPRDDRRPRARDLGGRRPLGEPRLRHRQLPEARPGDRRRWPPSGTSPCTAATGSAPSSPRGSGSTATRRCPAGWPPSGCCARVVATPRAVGGRRGDLAAALETLRRPPRRRGLVVVVSDFLATERLGAPAARAVGPARAAGHRGRSTRASWSCPTSGLLTVVDPESGQTLEVPTGNAEFRAKFAAGAAAQRARDRRRRSAAPAPGTCSCAPTGTG